MPDFNLNDNAANQPVPAGSMPEVQPVVPVTDSQPLTEGDKLPPVAPLSAEGPGTVGAGFLNRKVENDPNSPLKQTKEDFLKALGATVPPTATASTPEPVNENIEYYAMPKEFQRHNRVVGGSKGALAVVLTGVVMLFLAGGALYVYFVNPEIMRQLFGIGQEPVKPADQIPVADNQPTVPETPSETPSSTPALPTESPKDIYIKYTQGLSAAITFQDYFNLVSLYGSVNKREQAESEKMLAESAGTGDKTLATLKLATPTLLGSEQYAEQPSDTSAMLEITLADGVSKGRVDFVLEGDQWKIDNESWNLPGTSNGQLDYQAAEDRDADALTDAEEELLGADKESTDSDGDGYSDGQELGNLYNPAGKNKLVDNPTMKSYRNPELKFSMLVSSKWLVDFQQANGGGTVTFTSANGQLFSVTAVANTGKENIESYYQRLTGDAKVEVSQRLSNDNWEGVSTKDGLSVYLTDKQRQTIYSLSYNPGTSRSLDYIHLFEVVKKSFLIK
jgi:hypothetical protein